MKHYKTTILGVAAAIVVAVCVGASGSGNNRPMSVDESRWIPIGENAGFALTSDDATARTVNAELYLKTENGWRQGRIMNPAATDFLAH